MTNIGLTPEDLQTIEEIIQRVSAYFAETLVEAIRYSEDGKHWKLDKFAEWMESLGLHHAAIKVLSLRHD